MKQVQDVIERLWDFIDKLDINTFGELQQATVKSNQPYENVWNILLMTISIEASLDLSVSTLPLRREIPGW